MPDIFDAIVVGAGPSGLMTAGILGGRGASVLVLEKNNEAGKKILMTGRGRCNITQAESDIHKLIKAYGVNGRFLFSCFTRYSPQDVMHFFEGRGITLKVEDKGRVFPVSDHARDVVSVLKQCLHDNHVQVLYNAIVQHITTGSENSITVHLKDKRTYTTKNIVIATGGMSYPATGSTGDGLAFARELGHTIVSPIPALVPIKIRESWAKQMPGLSLKNVELIALYGGKKIAGGIGEMLFTHTGISGPLVLDMSKYIISALRNGEVSLRLNLMPDLSPAQMDDYIQKNFKKYTNKQFKNMLLDLLPRMLVSIIIAVSGIDGDKPVHSVTRAERLLLQKLLQHIPMTAIGDLGYHAAIVTSGGVSLKEVDPKTMQSKIHDHLYFVGEVLDIDGPTGGYNLQVAWSTGS